MYGTVESIQDCQNSIERFVKDAEKVLLDGQNTIEELKENDNEQSLAVSEKSNTSVLSKVGTEKHTLFFKNLSDQVEEEHIKSMSAEKVPSAQIL